MVDDLAAQFARHEAEILKERGALFKPLAAYAKDPDESPGVPFGLASLDRALMGGLRQGLHMLVGFSHHGKTQLLLRLLWENRHHPMVVFSPDEASEAVLFKLITIAHGIPFEQLVTWSANKKIGALQEAFPYLSVDEENRGRNDMVTYIAEAEQYYGQKLVLAAYDYLNYFGSARSTGEDQTGAIDQKATAFKELSKDTGIPWVVIHQANRGAARGDAKMDITKVAYGGVAQMETITSVRRQVFDPKADASVEAQEEHCPTMHVALLKNKQPYKYMNDGVPGTEEQYAIEKETGLVRTMTAADTVLSGLADLRSVVGQKWERRDD